MRYAYEPVPGSVDPVLSEYLSRQFNNLANAMDTVFIAPVLQALPQQNIPGGIVYIKDDGLYTCVSEAANGDAEWKKLATQ